MHALGKCLIHTHNSASVGKTIPIFALETLDLRKYKSSIPAHANHALVVNWFATKRLLVSDKILASLGRERESPLDL